MIKNDLTKMIACMLTLGWAGECANSHAADPPSKSPASRQPASDPLLDDLQNVKPAKREKEKPPSAPLAQRLQQELTGGEDIGEENQNPLLRIGRRMKLVEELLAAKITSDDTQKLQRIIADELNELVKQANQSPQGNAGQRKTQGGKQGKAGNPMGEGTGEARATQPLDSSKRLDSAPDVAAANLDPREVMRLLWGNLPEKVREQMLNAPVEQFLPKYEDAIRNYYKRLAEEPAPR